MLSTWTLLCKFLPFCMRTRFVSIKSGILGLEIRKTKIDLSYIPPSLLLLSFLSSFSHSSFFAKLSTEIVQNIVKNNFQNTCCLCWVYSSCLFITKFLYLFARLKPFALLKKKEFLNVSIRFLNHLSLINFEIKYCKYSKILFLYVMAVVGKSLP